MRIKKIGPIYGLIEIVFVLLQTMKLLSQECLKLRYTCTLRHLLINIRIKWRKPPFMDFNISFYFSDSTIVLAILYSRN